MDDLLMQAIRASRDSRDCLRTIDALRSMGFGDDAFPALHHLHDSAVRFYNFSKGVQRYRDDKNNHRVHQRLMYVLLSCPDGTLPKGKSFRGLADEAFKLIPPIE
jgi:hypothetical protein